METIPHQWSEKLPLSREMRRQIYRNAIKILNQLEDLAPAKPL